MAPKMSKEKPMRELLGKQFNVNSILLLVLSLCGWLLAHDYHGIEARLTMMETSMKSLTPEAEIVELKSRVADIEVRLRLLELAVAKDTARKPANAHQP
jgi:hypothetical protein